MTEGKNELATIRELFDFDDWATHRVLKAAAGLDDAVLDRPFELGFGTLRATIEHVVGTERIWLERCLHGRDAKVAKLASQSSVSTLADRWTATHRRWVDLIATWVRAAELDRTTDYLDMRGTPQRSRVLDVVLHVVNHGVYHRAQALNMLRHISANPPRVDYIFMHFESPREIPTALSREIVRYYYTCNDWMRDRVLDACGELDDEQLDRPFEMGQGSIRAALSHTEDAERWWLRNWKSEEPGAFPKPDKTVTITELRHRFDETSTERNAFIEALSADDDLKLGIDTRPAPDRVYTFQLGVTMLQLCVHGTHHRAQVVNMLRLVGVEPPRTDLILMTREAQS